MHIPEQVYISGGEVKAVPLLDRLSPEFWMVENQMRNGAEDARSWVTTSGDAEQLPFGGPSYDASLGELSQHELMERYVRRGQRLQAEQMERAIVAAIKAVMGLFHRIGGLFKGLSVDTDHLARPPYSR